MPINRQPVPSTWVRCSRLRALFCRYGIVLSANSIWTTELAVFRPKRRRRILTFHPGNFVEGNGKPGGVRQRGGLRSIAGSSATHGRASLRKNAPIISLPQDIGQSDRILFQSDSQPDRRPLPRTTSALARQRLPQTGMTGRLYMAKRGSSASIRWSR